MTDASHRSSQPAPTTNVRPVGTYVFWAFCGIAALFLLYEHTMHVLGVLPYLLLLACPLMHMFMHHGHGQRDAPVHDHTGNSAGGKEADHA
jgi:hypothetical protein